MKFKYDSVWVKLWLYVLVASFSSVLTDLSHYTCSHDTWSDITPIRWIIIVLNFIVQGMIAWRAFIDGSVEQQHEVHVQEMKQRALTHKINTRAKLKRKKR